ncbi:hypothetical protein ACQP3J_29655, partial [Escherichia coli]
KQTRIIFKTIFINRTEICCPLILSLSDNAAEEYIVTCKLKIADLSVPCSIEGEVNQLLLVLDFSF